MKLTEKMSYLKGYIDALDMDTNSKECKVITKMADLMDEMVAYIEDLQSQVDELNELCDALDEDLDEVEQEIFPTDFPQNNDLLDNYDDEDDFNEFDSEDQIYETTCPTCGRTILLDERMLEEGGVDCPCGESLEFDFESINSEDDDDLDIQEDDDNTKIDDLNKFLDLNNNLD